MMHKMFEYEHQYCCSTTCDRTKVEAEFKELQDKQEAAHYTAACLMDALTESNDKLTAIQEVIDDRDTLGLCAEFTLEEITNILNQS